MILERGKTWGASPTYVSQSTVLKSDGKPVPRWSVHAMRRKSVYSGNERRGYTLFLSLGRVRVEIGSR